MLIPSLRTIVLLLLCFAGQVCSAQQYEMRNVTATLSHSDVGAYSAPLQMTQLSAGPEKVGFRSQRTTDFSRPPLAEERLPGREVTVDTWYPAISGATPMTVRDYVLKRNGEGPSDTAAATDALARKWIESSGLQANDANRLLSTNTLSFANAAPAHTLRGIVVYGPGIGDQASDNFILCEALASRGFLVVAVPAVGFQQLKEVPTAKDLETAARDMEVALGLVRSTLPESLHVPVIVAGYSWGGLAAMIVQMRNPLVRAVISIDGSVASHATKAQQTAWYDLSFMRVPYLAFSVPDTREKLDRILSGAPYSPRTHVYLKTATHADLQSLSFLTSKNLQEEQKRAAAHAYEVLVQIATAFAEWSTARRADGLDAFVPKLPEETLGSVTTYNAIPSPPSEREFLTLLRTMGPSEARRIADDYRSRDPHVLLCGEQNMAEVGFSIFDKGDKQQGIQVLKLLVDMFPNDYKPHGYLGSLYEESGEKMAALTQYGIALGMVLNDSAEDDLQRRDDARLFRSLIEKLSVLPVDKR